VLDEARDVRAFASRAMSSWADDEAFRRLLVNRMLADMDLGQQPLDQMRHLHKEYGGQSYLVSYWQREQNGRHWIVVAWHDIGRIVKDTLPLLYGDATTGSKVNIVDEEGRIIF